MIVVIINSASARVLIRKANSVKTRDLPFSGNVDGRGIDVQCGILRFIGNKAYTSNINKPALLDMHPNLQILNLQKTSIKLDYIPPKPQKPTIFCITLRRFPAHSVHNAHKILKYLTDLVICIGNYTPRHTRFMFHQGRDVWMEECRKVRREHFFSPVTLISTQFWGFRDWGVPFIQVGLCSVTFAGINLDHVFYHLLVVERVTNKAEDVWK